MEKQFCRVLRTFVTISIFTPLLLSAQGTAFTYQGRLSDGSVPANGIYDLRFTIYDSTNLPGIVVAGPLTNSATIVSNGLFTVALDFGAGVFTGPDRWLEIGVRTNGAGAFTVLPARQLIAPTPYAINAANLGGALHVETNTNGAPNLVGGSFLNQVDPGFVGAVIGGGGATNYYGLVYPNRAAGDFSVVGGGLGNVNLSFGSVISGGGLNQIQTGGSYSGIASGGGNLIEASTYESFIGGGYGNSIQSFSRDSAIGGGFFNTNSSSFSIIAGGQYNVIESLADSSAIGGGWLNYIQSSADQSVIAGGNAGHILSGARESFIGGGFANTIQTNSANAFIGAGAGNIIGSNASFSTIAGGLNNSTQPNAQFGSIGGGQYNSVGFLSTVGGGQFNVISNAPFGTIGGGVANSIGGLVQYGTIGGGNLNQISQFAHGSTIAGGWSNSILFAVQMGTIGGGFANFIRSGGDYSFIGGGIENSNSGYISVIAGGDNNNIEPLSDHSAIGGGGNNHIRGSLSLPVYAIIGGGQFNLVQSNSTYSTIGGGLGNTVQTNAQYATIPGGLSNTVAGAYSFAAGNRAGALHNGTFVWADANGSNFNSSSSNQFLIRASGGVGIGVTNPTAALEVAGTVKATAFQGNASGLTMSADNISSGTLADARLSGNVALLNANQTFSGANTFNNSLNSFTGNGSGLTGLNGNNISSGTVSDTLLSGNVARLNVVETFTAGITFAGGAAFSGPVFLSSASGYSQTSAGNFSVDAPFIPGGRFIILTNGNVGIGTGNPGTTLHVYTASNPAVVRIQSTGTPGFGRIEFQSNPQGDGNEWRPAYIQSLDAGSFTGGLGFYLNGSGAGTRFGNNEVMRLINGNVGIGTNNPTQRLHVAGNILASGTVTGSSDRNAKENFKPVNASDVLDKVTALPITRWSYKADAGITHLGPMAQDFYAAFDIGMDDKHISMVDADGVALAAIQGLNQKVESENTALRVENTELKKRLERLERLMESKYADAK